MKTVIPEHRLDALKIYSSETLRSRINFGIRSASVLTAGVVTLLYFATIPIAAQSGSGKSSDLKVNKKDLPRPNPTPKPSRGSAGSHKPKPPKPVPIPVVRNGGVRVFVNYAPVEILIVGGNIVQSGPFPTAADGSPWTVEDLKPGEYVLTIRKPGFADTRREVKVVSGNTTRVDVVLSPTKAFLSVTAQPSDARIAISGLGEFIGRTGQIMAEPGNYDTLIERTGYISERHSILLSKVGDSRSINIVLRPLKVEQVLADAKAMLDRSQYSEAIRLAKLVIDSDSKNGKALAISGLSKFLSGMGGGADLIAAIDRGERISIEARRYNKSGKNSQLFIGTLSIDSRYIEFTSAAKPDQAFSIFKPEVSEISLRSNESGSNFVAIKGTGTFAGKKSTETINLYSPATLVRPDRRQTFCSDCVGTVCSCGIWTKELRELILLWRKPD